jgi:hypothetical protein
VTGCAGRSAKEARAQDGFGVLQSIRAAAGVVNLGQRADAERRDAGERIWRSTTLSGLDLSSPLQTLMDPGAARVQFLAPSQTDSHRWIITR